MQKWQCSTLQEVGPGPGGLLSFFLNSSSTLNGKVIAVFNSLPSKRRACSMHLHIMKSEPVTLAEYSPFEGRNFDLTPDTLIDLERHLARHNV
jgi:hypothetical protein